MNVLILRSARDAADGKVGTVPDNGTVPIFPDDYTQTFTTAFAEKIIGNLVGEKGFCQSCGPDCCDCRSVYDRHFGRDLAGTIDLPNEAPYLLEAPERFVPDHVPPHDVLLAINVHEQMFLEFLKRCNQWGTRAAVAPVEAPGWVSGSAREQAVAICEKAGVEIAFPKPFCAFDPPDGTVLAEFRQRFCIGKPSVRLKVKDGHIDRAIVEVSAACGATYYVARGLVGKNLDDDLKYEVIAKRLSAYPCTASMAWDEELADTIMHVSGQAHYEILYQLEKMGRKKGTVPAVEGLSPFSSPFSPAAEADRVKSPHGRMIQRPPSARDGVQNIECAKEAILETLAAAGEVSLQQLRAQRHLAPAAVSSAVLLLKQAGKIRTEGGKIFHR